ncbi:MAG: zinc ribbon domain-containing protein, partial [Clostridiales bacterium]|nr:zinc ribbon domain-containing protein [Clostridiales bacterium]
MFFFVSGVRTKSKDIGNIPNVICPGCGAYSNLYIAMIYETLHLFFIPTFKWNKRYLVTDPACGAVFELDRELGIAFERGEINTIDPSGLHKVSGFYQNKCHTCGAELMPGARFCS